MHIMQLNIFSLLLLCPLPLSKKKEAEQDDEIETSSTTGQKFLSNEASNDMNSLDFGDVESGQALYNDFNPLGALDVERRDTQPPNIFTTPAMSELSNRTIADFECSTMDVFESRETISALLGAPPGKLGHGVAQESLFSKDGYLKA